MDEQVDDLLSQGRDAEASALINKMLQEPVRTPMPPEVASGVMEAIVSSGNAPVVNIQSRRHWRRTAVACVAITILALGAGYFWWRTPTILKKADQQVQLDNNVKEAILPGGNKAVLTLADGSEIALDSNTVIGLPFQGNTKIMVQDKGTLAYYTNKQAAGNAPVLYNTIHTPNGGQYQVMLPDGTRVWLNAASSIRFPTSFAGERTVTVTGEVYFEVAHDKRKPFKVSADQLSIEVLGTHFNIKAYANDVATKTSLLTGSLKVNDQLIKPGQAYTHGQVMATNTDEDIAWKNGLFNLAGADLKNFMRQVERWYDVTVYYEGVVPGIEFQGKLNRAVPLSDIIDYLKNLGVECHVDGKKLFVTSI